VKLPPRKAVLEEVRALAPHVRQLVLAVAGEPLHYQAGQWLSLSLPIGERPPLTRAYSLAEPERSDGRVQLCLDRVPGSQASSYLFGLEPGASIDFSGPYGDFVLPTELTRDLFFVARFTGIVPLRCMLLECDRRGFPCDVTLVMGAARTQDLVYHDELQQMARRSSKLRYLATLLAPEAGWTGEVGTEMSIVHRLLREGTSVVPYVCGVREMVNEVRAVFTEFGFPRREVRSEVYG
jgi:NAD(P)H-flavin reductase